jgi:hypothetical protein
MRPCRGLWCVFAVTTEGEMADMRVQMTNGGRDAMGREAGEHDDLVLAVALTCWGVRRM